MIESCATSLSCEYAENGEHLYSIPRPRSVRDTHPFLGDPKCKDSNLNERERGLELEIKTWKLTRRLSNLILALP